MDIEKDFSPSFVIIKTMMIIVAIIVAMVIPIIFTVIGVLLFLLYRERTKKKDIRQKLKNMPKQISL
jgi:predicted membrane protein